jgi:5'(3')-deoxyribonucleotidase
MKKLVIAVDCDDVLVETGQQLLDHYNRLHGTTITGYTEIWKAVSTEATRAARDTYIDSDEYLASQPTQDAVRVLTKLNETSELHIVTGRPSFMQDVTLAWLERHLPDIFRTVIFTDFFKATGARSKADICAEIGADYLIDDHIHHCQAVAETGVHALLFGNYLWNKDFEATDMIQRVSGWADVEQVFRNV